MHLMRFSKQKTNVRKQVEFFHSQSIFDLSDRRDAIVYVLPIYERDSPNARITLPQAFEQKEHSSSTGKSLYGDTSVERGVRFRRKKVTGCAIQTHTHI